jgi:GNAT superfamily N-acetyltransferase
MIFKAKLLDPIRYETVVTEQGCPRVEAYKDAALVGQLTTKVLTPDPLTLGVVYVSVIPEYRRKGIATGMYKTLIEYAEKTGVAALYSDHAMKPGAKAIWKNLKEQDPTIIKEKYEDEWDTGHRYKKPFKTGFLSKVALPQSHVIRLQEAQDKGFFGPVYHGTTSDRKETIDREGFKIFEGEEGSGDIQHGYENRGDYSTKHIGVPAPVHHLGYGVYFTTKKAIAKQFNYGGAGIKTYYLDIPNYETINFGAPNTMMDWWIKNGYDPKLAKGNRVLATKKLTAVLKSKWDAVWFKGQGIRKLLDGDQICVYDPSRIYEISTALAQPGEVGSKVRRKSDGMRGVVTKRENIEYILEEFPAAASWVKPGAKWRMWVRWQKGGSDFNVQDVDVDFV